MERELACLYDTRDPGKALCTECNRGHASCDAAAYDENEIYWAGRGRPPQAVLKASSQSPAKSVTISPTPRVKGKEVPKKRASTTAEAPSESPEPPKPARPRAPRKIAPAAATLDTPMGEPDFAMADPAAESTPTASASAHPGAPFLDLTRRPAPTTPSAGPSTIRGSAMVRTSSSASFNAALVPGLFDSDPTQVQQLYEVRGRLYDQLAGAQAEFNARRGRLQAQISEVDERITAALSQPPASALGVWAPYAQTSPASPVATFSHLSGSSGHVPSSSSGIASVDETAEEERLAKRQRSES